MFNSLLKNYCARQSCVKNDEKMLMYSVYTALFSSFLPCFGFARYVFQQAVKRCARRTLRVWNCRHNPVCFRYNAPSLTLLN
jgi:hypothetical protein